MTDEEKKSIEIIKFLQYKCIEENGTGMMSIYRIDDLANAIDIVLNLIEKQQKEIEKKEFHLKATEQQREYDMKMIDDLKGQLNNKIDLIKEQQKEIEELKDTRSIFNMGRRSYKNEIEDKIKAKIEELNKEEKEQLKGTKGQDRYAIKQEYMYKRSGLQSLLEKE